MFINGICDGLCKDFLEIDADNRVYVKEDTFLEWQNLIGNMSPAFLIAAFFASYDDTCLGSNPEKSDIRRIYAEYILRNCKYTSLLSPDIKPINALFVQEEGFSDLHVHLNGITEMDAVWQNLLYDRDRNLVEISGKISTDQFKQQLEQINLCEKNDIQLIKKLLERALTIRDELFNATFSMPISEKRSLDAISGIHPFRNLFSPSDLEESLPNKEIRYEVLMFYVVLMCIKYGRNAKRLAELLHEYLLIYGFFEELLVHENNCYGFEQFQNITKNEIRNTVDCYQLNKFYQLSGNDGKFLNFVEFRFSPNNDIDRQMQLLQKIKIDWERFSQSYSEEKTPDSCGVFHTPTLRVATKDTNSAAIPYENNIRRCSASEYVDYKLIAHFIKKEDTYQKNNDNDENKEDSIREYIRYYELRKEIDDKSDKLITTVKTFDSENKIVAVDAAASEFDTPPEVFAPAFRKLRDKHIIRHFTYHAGEDFYHILDGLRAVYEAIEFLGLRHGDRIGHASATGTDVKTWADILMEVVPMPQGIYMDDLLFSHSFILDKKIDSLYPKLPILEIKTLEYARKIYGKSFPLEDLKSAWKQRSKDPLYIRKKNSEEMLYGKASDKSIAYEEVGDSDFEILSLYNRKDIYAEYRKPICVKTDDVFSLEELVLLQKQILEFMHKKEIVIEALPTSNLRIGYHRNLKSYQLFNWYQWKQEGCTIPPVVLGTDDPGIFSTNIYNEYAMLYCYLVYDRKMSRTDVMRFLQNIRDNSRIYAFK